ncbi:5'/3'-nucleotidase SurE [Tumidithrix helvetica PCC 7403]|uniref:5'/3'-nucleotidase SurE n=1 Tax=Tumidithrix helvetica TaxID=3457545 RepID=UPI003C9F9C9E
MALILTNDDGIDAPGIWALQKAVAKAFGTKAFGTGDIIVAPRDHHSGCGHQVTTHSPIHVSKRAEDVYAIAGTPADCVRVALGHLCLGDRHPEIKLVLSGINDGGNLGADVYISGTVAAVREAALHRIPGIAISHYRAKGKQVDWERAADLTAQVLTKLSGQAIPAGSFWNVNLPHLDADAPDPAMIFCDRSTLPLPVSFKIEGEYLMYAGNYQKRDRSEGTDVDVCFSGNIAITQIDL